MELTHRVNSIEESLKGSCADLKVYNIGVIGAFDATRKNVVAKNCKEAKQKYADFHNVVLSAYIVARKHDTVSLNDHSNIR